MRLEDRCLLAGDAPVPVPIPTTNPMVALSTIFWNGEAQPLNPAGKPNIQAPDKVGAAKTITIKNNSTTDTIYPFLRGGNFGSDPNSTSGKLYDPQDLTNHEFRQYVGYSTTNGTNYLGLPAGASITIQVPLVLWDGLNLYIATDGTNLTTATPNIFNYEANARISIAGAQQPVSDSIWVQASSGYAAGTSPLVMFYFSDGLPKTVPDDAPAQLTEITFRDPYLTQFITDPAQTFPLLNYDVSYVNNLVAPVSMEASHVPITYGEAQSSTTPPTYYGYEDFGWLATQLDTSTFQARIKSFVTNVGKASIGAYFGSDEKGWPAYYAPQSGETVIPSGANLFDDSPLNVNGGIVHTSSFDSNRWMLTSNDPGPIAARAGGEVLTNPRATQLPLVLAPEERAAFVRTINLMLQGKDEIDLTIAPSTTVLGQVTDYDAGAPILGISVAPGQGGSGYSKTDPPTVMIRGGGGTGAKAIAFVGDDGAISGVGLTDPGSGYTSPPTIAFVGGPGSNAKATAAIGGGTVTVTLNDGVNLPTNTPLSYVFSRPSKDYAITAITNLWYSWAQYYVQQYQTFADLPISATLNKKPIPGSADPTLHVTNEITLANDPPVPLAVGMTVTGTGVPTGTTILKIVGRQIYLSQIPDEMTTPANQVYTFGKPTMLPFDPAYTKPYALTFSASETTNARLFAGSVYQAMASQSVDLPASDYLPYSMNLVAHVIKFWAKLPGYDRKWGPIMIGEVRDIVKSILRGVYDFEAVPDQSLWYPEPEKHTGGQNFNVYNLDPYVWFVHSVLNMSAYGFSVDDDVSNPTATGPLLSADGSANHFPNNLQIGFGGVGGLGNSSQWFPTTPWGTLQSTSTNNVLATISEVPSGEFKGYSMVTFTGPADQTLKLYNQINNPGSGQVGAYITAPGYIVPGTTLIHKGPISGDIPQIVLSQNAIATPNGTSIKFTVSAAQMSIPKVPIQNADFSTPVQTAPNYYTVAPKGSKVFWRFSGTAGIAGNGSIYTKNNPAPSGTQVAFIQNTGGLSQTVALQQNTAYAVSFLVAQRRLDDGSINAQTLQVRLGSQVIGNFAPTSTGDGDGEYVLFTSDAFTVPNTGTYKLVIAGTNQAGGDNTALIDQVVITGGSTTTGSRFGARGPRFRAFPSRTWPLLRFR